MNTPVPGIAADISSRFVPATRVMWTCGDVTGAEVFIGNTLHQTSFDRVRGKCVMKSGDEPASVVIDFGSELHGLVRPIIQNVRSLQTGERCRADIRVRFGESVNEAMAEIGEKNATNDHINRDQIIDVDWLYMPEIGPTGFRFVRIDLLTPHTELILENVIAILRIRDLPYVGSFSCSDDMINRIWKVGAYTVQLCMQDYVWDGIKRDRLVWLGDMGPEVSTILAVFGKADVVEKSMDFARDFTPLPGYINNIESYSLWWIRNHADWYRHWGDIAYLRQQQDYLRELTKLLCGLIDEDGRIRLENPPFIEWPSSSNIPARYEGLQGHARLGLLDAVYLLEVLGEEETAQLARDAAQRLTKYDPGCNGNKQATATASLGGVGDRKKAEAALLDGGAQGLSTFWGYYTLCALAELGHIDAALADMREFWGAMIERGATSFWEDFSLDWLENAGRIDEITPDGVEDLHGDRGAYCYVGFRHSLCHGWAAGPTAFLSRYVLGVRPTDAVTFTVKPQLGTLSWVEGSYPTAKGELRVRHERQPDGSVKTVVNAPEGIRVTVEA
ncbi:MAG: alpha-L-rhamnosidase [Ruminococcaceae bacterium]|nr:alpha-L-rhamnosidase [Oscillospiraceae bacterium]